MKKKKSKSRPAAAAKGKDMGKDGTEGAILAEVAKASLFKKPVPVIDKYVSPGDAVK